MKLFFKKKYGQHILKDKLVINKIISMINPKSSNIMVEIGPGLGALTIPMIKYNNFISVIEIDQNFVNYLKYNKKIVEAKVLIFLANALKFNFNILFEKYNKKIRIFGSLPYNIATTLIFYLFNNYINSIKDMNFIMQKEVVNSLIANTGEKNYGCLSIMSQFYCKIKSLIEIKPISFYPIPKVLSNMVYIKPYKNNPYKLNNINLLKMIVQKAFSMRRKILRNSLKDLFSIDDLNYFGIDYKIRAENVSISEYCQLAQYLELHGYSL
ncbi:16S rRNA (adenine(1518)-N(6)/adenine(1519)-N(6))-dimethyltransferase RsmA [Enterobacteriaceae endosymbiont of Plateumaris braccata]|uniref:16S rRNA (adenine(1518)-N(6)/adenine(1519)-N(6))- dimethyltransferase RsmA n=1 Tax=Enterobacteriaceae endosymbiont of Plateumaris braccata TaxID=2675793 RepID=UPI001449CD4C|nr:16S rRNA (adenine(1518)-N(6)/adenine(1519)-N(6))-dimethyltransferase RsmA [Enterobacteriaceae endosymbiont of Plateumaris braccata]QJC28124.1 16S rRNA (adenine(1518)-N(6)/adenine(1519)-N(6))-dimethyltransferase RsmA [Enterobacteriaceae endosymbiont of Plateumaris braccata]